MKEKRFEIRMPIELFEALKKEADEKSISYAALVRMALVEYLKKAEKEKK